MACDAAVVLRDARKRAGLSQAELAERARVAQPVISAYETGRREPGLSTLSRLVEATGHELEIDVVPVEGRCVLPHTPIGRRLRRCRGPILAAAQRRGMSNLRVFGSVARGDDDEASDVDVLVDISDEVSLIDLIGFERELSEIVGRGVDVVPARNLKPSIAQRVLAEATDL